MLHAGFFRAEANSSRSPERSQATRSWKSYAKLALTSNISDGFIFTKPPLSGAIKPVAQSDGTMSVSDPVRLEDMTKVISTTWLGSSQPSNAAPFHSSTTLSLLLVPSSGELYQASLSFKRMTARADGWHPRHYANLDMDALTILGCISFW